MANNKLYYFAYGSNLHPMRLRERVPSAMLIGVATCAGRRLAFHKRSTDGSGKCNMADSGYESARVFGAIYSMRPEHKKDLDRFEGSGYTDSQILLSPRGTEYTCFTYLAQKSHIVDTLRPYHWYKQLVVLGGSYLGFPEEYLSLIKTVDAVEDPDSERRRRQAMLIENINRYR